MMTLLNRALRFAFAAATVALLAAASLPAHAEQPATHLGPVGPFEPILAGIGPQRVIAFYVPERGACSVNAVMWNDTDPDAAYASARVRVSLKPGQMFQLDGSLRQSMSLLCGADAATLAVVAPAELILTGTVDKN
jgi:hypothetical protein